MKACCPIFKDVIKLTIKVKILQVLGQLRLHWLIFDKRLQSYLQFVECLKLTIKISFLCRTINEFFLWNLWIVHVTALDQYCVPRCWLNWLRHKTFTFGFSSGNTNQNIDDLYCTASFCPNSTEQECTIQQDYCQLCLCIPSLSI